MKFFVIGGGGREHKIVNALARSPHVTRLWCAPGNGGIGDERLQNGEHAVCVPDVGTEGVEKCLAFALEHHPDITVVGPERPLACGIVDEFTRRGLPIIGPPQAAAKLEASKTFGYTFCRHHDIPVPQGIATTNLDEAKRCIDEFAGRCVVKPDGLHNGKGVVLCDGRDEAYRAAEAHMNGGRAVVIQKRLPGAELSLHGLCDGRDVLPLPSSQDHKRLLAGNRGPMTGGMGAHSPASVIRPPEHEQNCAAELLERWHSAACQAGLLYRGIIYPGTMHTLDGLRVLEWNVRFGDPEAQVILTRLESDLAEILSRMSGGGLRGVDISFSPHSAVCIVIAAPGYPDHPSVGKLIRGIDAAEEIEGVRVFHGGTTKVGGRYYSSGGRILGVTASAPTLRLARDLALEAVGRISIEDGCHFRDDIAAEALGEEKEPSFASE